MEESREGSQERRGGEEEGRRTVKDGESSRQAPLSLAPTLTDEDHEGDLNVTSIKEKEQEQEQDRNEDKKLKLGKMKRFCDNKIVS